MTMTVDEVRRRLWLRRGQWTQIAVDCGLRERWVRRFAHGEGEHVSAVYVDRLRAHPLLAEGPPEAPGVVEAQAPAAVGP